MRPGTGARRRTFRTAGRPPRAVPPPSSPLRPQAAEDDGPSPSLPPPAWLVATRMRQSRAARHSRAGGNPGMRPGTGARRRTFRTAGRPPRAVPPPAGPLRPQAAEDDGPSPSTPPPAWRCAAWPRFRNVLLLSTRHGPRQAVGGLQTRNAGEGFDPFRPVSCVGHGPSLACAWGFRGEVRREQHTLLRLYRLTTFISWTCSGTLVLVSPGSAPVKPPGRMYR